MQYIKSEKPCELDNIDFGNGKILKCNAYWNDETSLALDIGDGELTDDEGNDYFIHCEYNYDNEEWTLIFEIWFKDDSCNIDDMNEEEASKYITKSDKEGLEEIMNELLAEQKQQENNNAVSGFGVVLKEMYGARGMTRTDVIDLFDMLDDVQAYPIELMAHVRETSAMGFITPNSAKLLEYDYDVSGLSDFIANILDNQDDTETNEYEFNGIKIWLSRNEN